MNRHVPLACVLALTSGLLWGCSNDKSDDVAAAMPVANSWKGTAAQPSQANPSDPHAGLDMGGADPHAGLDMGGADPHAGLDMGNSNPGGLEAPDPDREIDPTMFLKGTLTASKETAPSIKAGAIVFISVRPVNKATGESIGAPLAVDRLDVATLPIDFHLSAAQMMVAGTRFEGDVVIYARVDGDGEASSTLPGDIEGRVAARIPADGISLVLDTVVP